RDGVRLQGKAELHGRQREGDLDGTEGGLQPDTGARQVAAEKTIRDERCKGLPSCAARVLGLFGAGARRGAALERTGGRSDRHALGWRYRLAHADAEGYGSRG